jgi:hypothetical protein
MYYKYGWKNNQKREALYGRTCRILASGKMGSVAVEFGNGQREIISRRALRKIVGCITHKYSGPEKPGG